MSLAEPATDALNKILDTFSNQSRPVKELVSKAGLSIITHAAIPASALSKLFHQLQSLTSEEAAACLQMQSSIDKLASVNSTDDALMQLSALLRTTGLGSDLDGTRPAGYIGVMLATRGEARRCLSRLREVEKLVPADNCLSHPRRTLEIAIERTESRGDPLVLMTYWGVTAVGTDSRSTQTAVYIRLIERSTTGKSPAFPGKTNVLLEALELFGSDSSERLQKWTSSRPWTLRSNIDGSAVFARCPLLSFDPSDSHGSVAAEGFMQSLVEGQLNSSSVPGIPPAFLPHPASQDALLKLNGFVTPPSSKDFIEAAQNILFIFSSPPVSQKLLGESDQGRQLRHLLTTSVYGNIWDDDHLGFEMQYLDIDESPGSNKLSKGETHRREDILALGKKLDRLPACTMIVLCGRAALHAEDKMSGTTARQRDKI